MKFSTVVIICIVCLSLSSIINTMNINRVRGKVVQLEEQIDATRCEAISSD